MKRLWAEFFIEDYTTKAVFPKLTPLFIFVHCLLTPLLREHDNTVNDVNNRTPVEN